MNPYALKLVAAALMAMPAAGVVFSGAHAQQSPAVAQAEATTAKPKVTNRQEWLTHLQGELNRVKRLPPELHPTLFPGQYKVILGFEVDPAGQISGIVVHESSGQPGLDQAAQKTVQSISPLPAFTADMSQKAQQFRLPMMFVIPEPAALEASKPQ